MIRVDDHIKKNISKKWHLDQFVDGASQRNHINQQVRDMNNNYKISKVKHQPWRQVRNGKVKEKKMKRSTVITVQK